MKRLWLRLKKDSAPHLESPAEVLEQVLKAAGFAVQRQPAPRADLALCLGGDGTLLAALREVGAERFELPWLGLHASDGLGFLHSLELPRDPARAKVFAEKLGIALHEPGAWAQEKRWGLELSDGQKKAWAMNDVVLTKGSQARLAELRVSVAGGTNGEIFERLRGDGLILASPTGSTAYSLSAGGPVVGPELSALVLTPICPHVLAQRSLVLSGHDVVKVDILPGQTSCTLTLDGQEKWEVPEGRTLEIRLASRPVTWLRNTDRSLGAQDFLGRLRNKLHFGA